MSGPTRSSRWSRSTGATGSGATSSPTSPESRRQTDRFTSTSPGRPRLRRGSRSHSTDRLSSTSSTRQRSTPRSCPRRRQPDERLGRCCPASSPTPPQVRWRRAPPRSPRTTAREFAGSRRTPQWDRRRAASRSAGLRRHHLRQSHSSCTPPVSLPWRESPAANDAIIQDVAAARTARQRGLLGAIPSRASRGILAGSPRACRPASAGDQDRRISPRRGFRVPIRGVHSGGAEGRPDVG